MHSVTRNADGSVTTITLTHNVDNASDMVEYTSRAVDTDHEIAGWDGQTLKRSSDDVDDMLATPQEATVYTNIEPATERKLTYGGDDATSGATVPPPSSANPIVLDAGQDAAEINMPAQGTARMFTGTIGGVAGTFTCANTSAAICGAVTTMTNDITSQITLDAMLDPGWTFESDDYVEKVAAQDSDYMYFGYWLQSPEDSSAGSPAYEFVAFHGGAAPPFEVETALSGNKDDKGLTATYVGGAAGRYVTRKLRVKDDAVDPQSPGYHGRFTATATLTANFGMHDEFDMDDKVDGSVDTRHKIKGTITDFMDGDTDLGFEVTLGLTSIGDGTFSGTTTAIFSDTATSTGSTNADAGTWSGQTYGPAPVTTDLATDDMPADVSTKLPSGVAGLFNAKSTIGLTKVSGAYAAEKQ